MIIDKKIEVSMLYDFYQSMLTETQKNIMELYYHYDLSLSEIAEEIKVSRQAVYDHIKRTEKILFDYEGKLSLMKKEKEKTRILQEAKEIMQLLEEKSLPGHEETSEMVEKLKSLLDQLSI